eukprot:1119483-Pleurochrysis_carterae.AAC.2
MYVPFLSEGAIAQFAHLTKHSAIDNFLLEIFVALELEKLIVPVYIGTVDGDIYREDFPFDTDRFPDIQVQSIEERVARFCKQHRRPRMSPPLSVRGAMESIYARHGCKMRGVRDQAFESVTDNLLRALPRPPP